MAWRARSGAAMALMIPVLCAQTVDFNRDIRPILSDRCFACHGPDAARRQAGLRLDVDGGARAVSDELLRRVAADDPAERMPPPSSGKAKLTAREVELLRNWIGKGAKWQPFWSFIPPRAAQAPAVKSAKRVENPIDRFVLARLEREGLRP